MVDSPIKNIVDHIISHSEFILSQVNFSIFSIDGEFGDEVDDIRQEDDVNENSGVQTSVVELPTVVFEHGEDPDIACQDD